MKALVKERPAPVCRCSEIELPRVANPDDVLFKVEYCAICVGETKVYDWGEWAANDKTLQLPTVLGHEAAGTVVEVGSAVTPFKPGDRIVNDPLIYCGHCRQCRSGFTNMCENREIYGKRRGAFAEYAVLPERVICPLPRPAQPGGGRGAGEPGHRRARGGARAPRPGRLGRDPGRGPDRHPGGADAGGLGREHGHHRPGRRRGWSSPASTPVPP